MAKKKTSGRKPDVAFMKPVTPSDTLAEVVGSKPMTRTEVAKKLWAYIKKNGLQDKSKATRKFQLVMNAKFERLLKELKERTNADTLSDVIRDAVKFYAWAVDQQEMGKEVVAQKPAGGIRSYPRAVMNRGG